MTQWLNLGSRPCRTVSRQRLSNCSGDNRRYWAGAGDAGGWPAWAEKYHPAKARAAKARAGGRRREMVVLMPLRFCRL